MKLVIVAVYDSAVSAFMRPFFVPHQGHAVRSFTDEINSKEPNALAAHPDDYSLFRLGVFDEDTGNFEENDPQCIARGKDVVIKSN